MTAVYCRPSVSTSICARPRVVYICLPQSTPVRGKNRGKGHLLPRKKMRFGAFYHGSRDPKRPRVVLHELIAVECAAEAPPSSWWSPKRRWPTTCPTSTANSRSPIGSRQCQVRTRAALITFEAGLAGADDGFGAIGNLGSPISPTGTEPRSGFWGGAGKYMSAPSRRVTNQADQ
jgi:hypothetical protein